MVAAAGLAWRLVTREWMEDELLSEEEGTRRREDERPRMGCVDARKDMGG
jgi:hypothetical protein